MMSSIRALPDDRLFPSGSGNPEITRGGSGFLLRAGTRGDFHFKVEDGVANGVDASSLNR